MKSATVLYDTPGPWAIQRNRLYAIGFLVGVVAVAWWVLGEMDDKGQLDWDKWSPYLAGTEAWTTYLLPGIENTLTAAGLSILIALPVGALLGIARMSDHRTIRAVAGLIVEFFRAIPVLILMLFANTAYSLFIDVSADNRPLYAVVTGLVLYNASVLAEVVRAGIQSLPSGQSEAAYALGMRKGAVVTTVLLPQAVTAMLPALVSQLVVIVKDTAIGGAVLGFGELINQARPASSYYQANTIATLTVIAAIFILINRLLTWFANWLERWLRARGKGGGRRVVVTPAGQPNVPAGTTGG